MEHFPGVTFAQPSATLDFSDEPVAGWFLQQGMQLRKVRFTCLYTDVMQYTLMYILIQIEEEDIDIQEVLSRFQSGDNLRSSEILKQLENHKRYPPRLSLEIFRSQHAREHLKTDVTINGIEPQLKCPLFTLCPGIGCTIVL